MTTDERDLYNDVKRTLGKKLETDNAEMLKILAIVSAIALKLCQVLS